VNWARDLDYVFFSSSAGSEGRPRGPRRRSSAPFRRDRAPCFFFPFPPRTHKKPQPRQNNNNKNITSAFFGSEK
jgi:hypothetical protein